MPNKKKKRGLDNTPAKVEAEPDQFKVWRNPLCLFRGADFVRYFDATKREPLTFYDKNLSAQDHQEFFTCESDASKLGFSIMHKAWRKQSVEQRVNSANAAIKKDGDCTTAYILLAEEEAPTIVDSEKLLTRAFKSAKINLKKSQRNHSHVSAAEDLHRRDVNVMIYIKRRLAMCARRLGKLNEAVKMFRELTKEVQPIMSIFQVHENLLEGLLESQAYADAQAVLSKYDDSSFHRSAALCYTSALLKVRQVSEKFVKESGLIKRSLSENEIGAIAAIHRAVEYNPYVPKYLLELKLLVFPPEHFLKRGDSEAVAYAFSHLPHWRRVDGALEFLHSTCEGYFADIPRPQGDSNIFFSSPPNTECQDRELLPAHHDVSVFPDFENPFFFMVAVCFCTLTASITLMTWQYPELMLGFSNTVVRWLSLPIVYVMDKVKGILPLSLTQLFSRD